MTALPEPLVPAEVDLKDAALEQRMRLTLERYYASRNPQDWGAFVELHRARSRERVEQMERERGLA